MKRSLAMVLALALAFTMTACGSTPTSSDGAVGASIQRNQTTQQLESTPESPEPEEPEAEYVPHDPIVLTGSGDDVLEIDSLDYYYAFRITGGAAGKHFAVTTYDANGNYSELLVNATGQYSGVTYDPSLNVGMIEVKATGEWTIEIVELLTLDIIEIGDTLTGTGDSVFSLLTAGKTATISGGAAGKHFAVTTYNGYGQYNDLLVNTTDPYEGKVILEGDPVIAVVKATGDWSFTLN